MLSRLLPVRSTGGCCYFAVCDSFATRSESAHVASLGGESFRRRRREADAGLQETEKGGWEGLRVCGRSDVFRDVTSIAGYARRLTHSALFFLSSFLSFVLFSILVSFIFYIFLRSNQSPAKPRAPRYLPTKTFTFVTVFFFKYFFYVRLLFFCWFFVVFFFVFPSRSGREDSLGNLFRGQGLLYCR